MARIRSLLIIVLILLTVLLGRQGWAQQCVEEPLELARLNPAIVGGSVPVTAGCTYPTKESSSGGTDFPRVCRSTWQGVAMQFSAGSSYDIRRISVNLNKAGSPVCTGIKAYLYSNKTTGCQDAAAACPDAVLATSTTAITCESTTTSQANYDFDIDSPGYSVVNGTVYWVVIKPTTITTCDSDNSVNAQYTSSGGGAQSRLSFYNSAVSDFNLIDNGYTYTYVNHSCN